MLWLRSCTIAACTLDYTFGLHVYAGVEMCRLVSASAIGLQISLQRQPTCVL